MARQFEDIVSDAKPTRQISFQITCGEYPFCEPQSLKSSVAFVLRSSIYMNKRWDLHFQEVRRHKGTESSQPIPLATSSSFHPPEMRANTTGVRHCRWGIKNAGHKTFLNFFYASKKTIDSLWVVRARNKKYTSREISLRDLFFNFFTKFPKHIRTHLERCCYKGCTRIFTAID